MIINIYISGHALLSAVPMVIGCIRSFGMPGVLHQGRKLTNGLEQPKGKLMIISHGIIQNRQEFLVVFRKVLAQLEHGRREAELYVGLSGKF